MRGDMVLNVQSVLLQLAILANFNALEPYFLRHESLSQHLEKQYVKKLRVVFVLDTFRSAKVRMVGSSKRIR